MPRPHGGKLITRQIKKDANELRDIKILKINTNLAEDILNITKGVFSPLTGFLSQNDLENVIAHKRLSDDTPWTIPIILDIEKSNQIKEGDQVLLVNQETGVKALLEIEDIYKYDKKELVQSIFTTKDKNHPGVEYIYNLKDHLIGGKLSLIESKTRDFDEYNLSPRETRVLFKEKGWKEIVAFQTRNPPHIGHEYVQKTALTFVDGIFINPIIGKKKIGDFKDEVILKSYDTLIKHYYLKERAVLSLSLIHI